LELSGNFLKPLQELESLLIPVSFDNGTALRTASSPQNSALNWLAFDPKLDLYSNATKIQRYALATLFYSTSGTSWNEKKNWMSSEDECDWYNSANILCTRGSVETLSLSENNLVGTIPNELALLSNLGESSVVSLLVIMIVMCFSLYSHACFVIFHSTATLYLSFNSLIGTIPSQIALMSNLCESSIVWLLVVRIVLSCVFHRILMLACHYLFYSWVVSLRQ
jgi:hypothetical protein